MTASTLLCLLKPRLTQISPHHDVDMWGRVSMSRFRGRSRILTLINNIYFFETLVFATSGILSINKQLVTLHRESKAWNRIKWPIKNNSANIHIFGWTTSSSLDGIALCVSSAKPVEYISNKNNNLNILIIPSNLYQIIYTISKTSWKFIDPKIWEPCMFVKHKSNK